MPSKVNAYTTVGVYEPCNFNNSVAYENNDRQHGGDNAGYTVDFTNRGSCSGTTALASISGTAYTYNEYFSDCRVQPVNDNDEDPGNDRDGYNTVLEIQGANGIKVRYLHFSSYSVGNGSTVNVGDQVGIMGNLGCASGNHIHFEVYKSGTKLQYNSAYFPSNPNEWMFVDSNSCNPPTSGTWTITQDCEISTLVSYDHDLTIDNNATVTIKSNGNFNLDFANKKLTIKYGSKLYIINGGKLY